MNTYGVINRNGDYNDVSNTERGAKNYASRHGYKEVYIRFNCGYHIDLLATKHNNKWITGV
jgi:hypothetical protein